MLPRNGMRFQPGGAGRDLAATLALPLLFAALFLPIAFLGSVPLAAAALGLAALMGLCLFNTLLAIGALLFSMMLSPEIRLQGGIILRGDDLVIPLLVLALTVRACLPRFQLKFRFSGLDHAMLALTVINALGSLRGCMDGTLEWRSAVLWNLKLAQLFLICWILFNYVREPAQVRTMVKLAMVLLLTITVYAFTQIPGTEVHTLHRLSSPFEDNPEPTTLGGYLTLQLALVASFAVHERRGPRKVLLWGLVVLVMIPILFTLSRTTYASCLVLFVLLGILSRQAHMAAAIIGALLLAPVLLPEKIISRVLMTFDPSRPYGVDASLAERIDVWRKVIPALRAHPFLGYGLPQPIIDSQFARTLIESGLLGMLGWSVVLGMCIRYGLLLRRRATDSFHQALGTAHVIGTIVLLVHGFAAITFYIVRIMEPYWFLTGIVISLNAWYATREAELAAATVRADSPRPARAR